MKKLLFLIMFISLCLSSISAQQKVNEAQVRQQIGAVASPHEVDAMRFRTDQASQNAQ